MDNDFPTRMAGQMLRLMSTAEKVVPKPELTLLVLNRR